MMEGDHDLLIIGGGLTGVATARRAKQLGLKPLVAAANPGSLPYTSGALDLLAVYPTETKHYRRNPWEAVEELVELEPDHPYGKVGLPMVQHAWEDLASYLESSPLRYFRRQEENLLLVTAAGTLKPTHLVPRSMQANVLAWESKEPTLVLGFERLVDFTPEHVAESLRDRWPGLRAARLDVAAVMSEQRRIRTAELAASFERAAFRERFADAVRPLLGEARWLGLPAVLGFDHVVRVIEELERRLEVKVFEIPMLSPSLPGMRLAELLKGDLSASGVDLIQGQPVSRLSQKGDRVTGAVWRGRSVERHLESDSVVLATGRFFGGGLVSDRYGVREPLLDLFVDAPSSRDSWHMRSFLGASGHPINRVGLVTNAELKPLDGSGTPIFTNLFAAGAILAGHDWVREKSGAGISIVTAYAAAEQAAGEVARG